MPCPLGHITESQAMENIMLPFAVLVFGLVALIICYKVLTHHDKYWMSEAIVIISIPITITVIVFLLVSKVVPDNTKELFAILSIIIGFIFGRASNKLEPK